jgi:excisionase family DNA binding protein
VDEILTAAEIAELLKLNQQTVRNMIDRSDLRAVRVRSRRVRVRRSDLHSFLGAGTSPNPGIDKQLERPSELLNAAGRGDARERISALTDLAVAVEALAARMEAGLGADAGKVDDARRRATTGLTVRRRQAPRTAAGSEEGDRRGGRPNLSSNRSPK